MDHLRGDSYGAMRVGPLPPSILLMPGHRSARRMCACLLLAFSSVFAASPPVVAARQADSPSAQAGREQELRRAVSRSLGSLGVFYYERQEAARAIGTLEEALKYDPESADIRTNLAMLYLQQQQFERVLETLGALPDRNERDRRALTALAVCSFVLGRYPQAASYYSKLAEMQPGDKELVLTLAASLYLNGDIEESKRVLLRVPDDAATRAQYHAVLADAFRFRAKIPQALAEYEKAIALAPSLPMVNYRLGVLQSELHEYDKAAQSFRRELKISPDSPDANYSLGAYYLNYGSDPGAAKTYFEKTLQLNPQHLGAYLGLMKIYLSASQAAEALQLAEKAKELGRGNDEFHYLMSRIYNLLGKKELAEEELKIFEQMNEKKD
jgi:tetratricopeptide (TPR) repeat protein